MGRAKPWIDCPAAQLGPRRSRVGCKGSTCRTVPTVKCSTSAVLGLLVGNDAFSQVRRAVAQLGERA
jgi:hypothetical protein